MRLEAGFASNLGLVRQTNEDSYLLRPGLYAVCDGMGGARAGEIASEMACRGLLDVDPRSADGPSLVDVVRAINQAIAERSGEEPSLLGMGTTLTAALVGTNKVTVVHVGDSRAYLLHEGSLNQLTDDHSWVGEMIRRGELTPAEAAIHPHRSVITKALGTDRGLDPDLEEVEAGPGDRFLLCSDGLTGMVSDYELTEILGGADGPQEAADTLVAAALAAGGEDNVTVIVVDLLPDAAADQPGPSPAGSSAEQAPDAESGASAEQTTPGAPDDEIILGPVDRAVAGAAATATPGHMRGMRAAARGKLGGRLGGRLSRPGADRLQAAGPASPPAAPIIGVPTAAEQGVLLGRGDAGSPEVRPRRRRRRWFIVIAIVVVVLVVAAAGFAVFNSSVYYVGTHEGSVALFNGLPGSILGIELSSVVEQGTVWYDSLPSYVRARIDTHELTTKEEGQRYLRSLSAVQ